MRITSAMNPENKLSRFETTSNHYVEKIKYLTLENNYSSLETIDILADEHIK